MVSKLIEFTNILQQHGWGSRQAKELRAKYANDKVFMKRAEIVESLFRNRNTLKKSADSRKVGNRGRSKNSGLHTDPI